MTCGFDSAASEPEAIEPVMINRFCFPLLEKPDALLISLIRATALLPDL